MKQFMWLLLWLPLTANAQFFEAGIRGGMSYYRGELDTKNALFSFNLPKAAYGVFARANLHEYLALRSDITIATIQGDDAKSSSNSLRKRNLSFKSNIIEANLVGELNLYGYDPSWYTKLATPYVFGGIGFFHHNPKTLYQGDWVALKPLNTEGQGLAEYPDRKPYSLTQICIPFGGGIKIAAHRNLTIGVEIGTRYTFTDYLDDVSKSYVDYNLLMQNYGQVSADLGNRQWELGVKEKGDYTVGGQRGDIVSKDWYIFITTTVSYNFIGDTLFKPSQRTKNNRARRCFKKWKSKR